MHVIYALMRFYPFWALPVGLVLFELAFFFRRKNQKKQFFCFLTTLLLCVSALFWIILRGDLNSDAWVRSFFSIFL